MAKSYALEHWEKGQVTLLEAFGVSHKSAFKFPKLTANLPSEAAQAQIQSSPTGGSAPKHAKTYTQKQLQQLWIQAGGDPSKALMASAVAMAESGGRANAQDDDSNGTVDKGLWQINTSNGALSTYNPIQNARSAVQLSDNGTNWGDWVTYNNGDYLQYM